MKIDDMIAFDVHTHAEVSCRQPADAEWQRYEDATGVPLVEAYGIRPLDPAA